nr:hypothetical protein B0A51_15218 [Rachicladosporium sp. CCFEE 5018]
MANGEGRGQYAHLPIPSYEEATSRPSSSSGQHQGPSQTGDDAERQGLLFGQGDRNADATTRRPGKYRAPAVESARASMDSGSDLSIPEMVDGEGQDALRQVEQFDYMEPGDGEESRQSRLYHRPRIRTKFSQHLTSIGATLSAIRIPSLRSLYTPVASAESGSTESQTWRERVRASARVPGQMTISIPIFARLVGLFTIAALIWFLFAIEVFPNNLNKMGMHFDPESVRIYVQEHIDAESIQGYLYHITSFDHVAGTEGDLYLARWMEERWKEMGVFDQVALLDYYVYLNYPTKDGRSVEIVSPEDRKWTAALEEDSAYRDRQQSLAWHGHSRSGEVEGPLVYANGGSREDFAYLQEHGVNLNGTVALVKYYSTQGDRALKVKAAEEAGCVGALIYSDPADDGAGKGLTYPAGAWRPADGVQRGSVSLMSWVVGDPLTPGWASTLDAQRVSKDHNPGLVNIPSLPLAWRDAEILLSSLDGVGKEAPREWVGGTNGLPMKWFIGGGDKAPVVHLKNLNDENPLQTIWNLQGIIQGIEAPEKKVIVGNHRDSWCFGAVDPGSGSAVMMELVSIFGALRKLGWRPLRTIEFASWDAEEYNLVGSTEYVEDKIDYLRENGIAYLNVDVGVSGSKFRAAGSPVWQRSLLRVLDRVTDPQTNETLRQLWDEGHSKLEGLGAGSDYVAFQDIAGTSSIDFGFEGPEHGFPYHSCYETFEWMQRFGDVKGDDGAFLPYHRTLAQIWALLILEIADRPLIPFDLRTYADAMMHYAEELSEDATKALNAASIPTSTIDLDPIFAAASFLKEATAEFHAFEDTWATQVLANAGGMENRKWLLKRLEYNERISRFETDLLDLADPDLDDPRLNGKGRKKTGIPRREQFKHVIFGPQAWSGYDEAYFPAVRDMLAAGNWTGVQEYTDIAAARMRRAGERLSE